MKNDNITTALNFVPAILAILGVIFALQTIFPHNTPDLVFSSGRRSWPTTPSCGFSPWPTSRLAYNQKNPNPDLTRLLQAIQTNSPRIDPMNASQTNSPTPIELTDEIVALRHQIFTLLLALIVVSGTLTVYLYRQARVLGNDIEAIKPQARQIIQQAGPARHGNVRQSTRRLRPDPPGFPTAGSEEIQPGAAPNGGRSRHNGSRSGSNSGAQTW